MSQEKSNCALDDDARRSLFDMPEYAVAPTPCAARQDRLRPARTSGGAAKSPSGSMGTYILCPMRRPTAARTVAMPQARHIVKVSVIGIRPYPQQTVRTRGGGPDVPRRERVPAIGGAAFAARTTGPDRPHQTGVGPERRAVP
ncbi:hypothetical protein KRM28CT15_08120 [Krasilnikovia sp. M28-CT-15]